MRNTINANELNDLITLAKNDKAWKAKYGSRKLSDVLEAKTGKDKIAQQEMTKLPPRRLQPLEVIFEKKYGKPTIVNGKKVWKV